MKVVFTDGTWVLGDRNRRAIGFFENHETRGTHHMFVLEGSEEFNQLVGAEIAVVFGGGPVKYFVLNQKKQEACLRRV